MSFKTPLLCDRRVYDKKGKWKNPNNDIEENIFYYIRESLTLTPSFNSYGKEEMREEMTICVFGGKPFVKNDIIKLEDGTKMKVGTITINYAESNILIKDMLKPRIESIDLTLM